jgi:hypothetical protein
MPSLRISGCVEERRFLGLPVHPTSFSCRYVKHKVYSSQVASLAVKGQNVGSYSYSYTGHNETHMKTAELKAACESSCRQSSYRSNTCKMKYVHRHLQVRFVFMLYVAAFSEYLNLKHRRF